MTIKNLINRVNVVRDLKYLKIHNTWQKFTEQRKLTLHSTKKDRNASTKKKKLF